MTVTPPDFDKQLKNHTAIAIDGVCHAITSGLDEHTPGKMIDKTECGITPVDALAMKTRIDFADDGVPMCRQCWPDHIMADND